MPMLLFVSGKQARRFLEVLLESNFKLLRFESEIKTQMTASLQFNVTVATLDSEILQGCRNSQCNHWVFGMDSVLAEKWQWDDDCIFSLLTRNFIDHRHLRKYLSLYRRHHWLGARMVSSKTIKIMVFPSQEYSKSGYGFLCRKNGVKMCCKSIASRGLKRSKSRDTKLAITHSVIPIAGKRCRCIARTLSSVQKCGGFFRNFCQ